MNKPIVFMFTGQGSQYYQMGEELYHCNSKFKEMMDKMDYIVHDLIGESVVKHMYDPNKRLMDGFDRTLHTHPAIFMVEYALAQVLQEKGIEPSYVLGTSLGEFVSVAFSGAMSMENALTCVVKQAQLLEKNCESGAMLAILGNPDLYEQISLIRESSELASVNYSKHFVVAGKNESLREIQSLLSTKNISSQLLPVSHAFHSSLVDPIEDEYRDFLQLMPRKKTSLPLLSCLKGSVINQISDDYFWNVVRKPFFFEKAIQSLEQQGDFVYLDVGPSGTLNGFINKNLSSSSNSKSYSIMTPFRQEEKRIQALDEYKSNLSYDKKQEKKENGMKAYVFPGQGSQRRGMGDNLFDEFPEMTSQADGILGYSIKELCLEDPDGNLRQTQFTQPALYVVSALSFAKRMKETGSKPDYVAGHSVGEYAALFAAGAYDFVTGLKLVKKRGELMANASGGGMAAVIGMDADKIRETLDDNELDSIDIANFNTPSQIVIAGPRDSILKASSVFEKAGVSNYIPLNVSGAFHSRYMETSREEFAAFLKNFTFQSLKIPVISNITARPYRNEDVHKNLVNQITSSVNWTDSMRYLMTLGVEDIEEVGPGSTLERMLIKIRKEAEPLLLEDEQTEQISGTSHVLDRQPEMEQNEKVKINREVNEVNLFVADGKNNEATSLGDNEFKKDYNLKYAYVVGSMHHGVSSADILVRLAKAGLMGYLGSSGLSLVNLEDEIRKVSSELSVGQSFGVNLSYSPYDSEIEEELVNLILQYEIRNVEASGYMSITPALVRYRLKGLRRQADGSVEVRNRILAKVTRPEVAELFLSPAPEHIISQMMAAGHLSHDESELLKCVPLADDLCVIADSGGPTEQGTKSALMPVIIMMRDKAMRQYGYSKRIRVGAGGGIGTPQAVAAAFILGADFIMTGSINHCTVEAKTSKAVKDILNDINVQDTTYAPAEELFEMGVKVQVLKKGMFFPARANKLFALYNQYNSIHEIDEKTKKQLQEKYFGKSFEAVYEDVKLYAKAAELERAEQYPKVKMAMIFKWYLRNATQLALQGNTEKKVDYQVYCGPALGSFNQWVKGTSLENWRNRHVDDIADLLIREAASELTKRLKALV
ncbi:ACP S-malonyltransferase (plasmid) [Bacillus cereus]|uniref:ACP S-malonyltransferase n=1 Tax=Bacillus cereus TaxID=1396 RepID=UPI001560BCF2|nr:ACP S-malonyltransferase [Bacillus cereus]QKH04697.1 ACP S-malonyltransferase [Bacillus cereus]QKH10459.1 ACP S-malonyltransferase [Bacillus cereus]